jgi:hypothetical protein
MKEALVSSETSVLTRATPFFNSLFAEVCCFLLKGSGEDGIM